MNASVPFLKATSYVGQRAVGYLLCTAENKKKKMCDFKGKSTADQAALTSYDNYTSAPTNLLHVLKSAFELAVMIAAILFHINVGR